MKLPLRIIRSNISLKEFHSVRSLTTRNHEEYYAETKFERVFSFPLISYIALLNRLKVYHISGTILAIPSCGFMEMLNVIPNHTLFTVSCIGVTGAAVLSLASLAFRNTIGHLYISEDNQQIKISSVDFWGKRNDRTVPVEDWIPLYDSKPKALDFIYLTAKLTNGTKYKIFFKFGTIYNAQKVGQVLE